MEHEKDCDLEVVGAVRECPRASEEVGNVEILSIFMEDTRFELGLRNCGIWGEAEKWDFWLRSFVNQCPKLTSQLQKQAP